MSSTLPPKNSTEKIRPDGLAGLRELRGQLRAAAPAPEAGKAAKPHAAAARRGAPAAKVPPTQPVPPSLPFRNPPPRISFPEELPVSGRRADIAAAISANQVVIVCGETGSGKTTQLPKICLELGRGQAGLIGHTQPRRIAASSTAKRIAQELNSPLGEHVGFKVRFTDTLTAGASVKLMTDGILLAETQGDPLLRQYDTIIIDEAHERSLNIDFLLGYLKQLLPKRPDLKVIITSATIDAQRFANHFAAPTADGLGRPAPVIEVSGRLYPVELRYRPVQDSDKERDLMDAITDAVDELCRIGSGDVLVFLPGEREIRDAAEALRKHHPAHVEILPLFARLSAQEQERVFKVSNARRIVLATNVAETSLTVPGIRFVVDTGLARVKRYSYRNKVEQLQIEAIAQSAANQRAGRCGRVAAGVCIRLYEESDFLQRVKFTEPEILRSSLAAVILRMKSLRLADVEEFPFIEPPPGRAIADGYQLLQELGAMDEANQLTSVGRQLAKLPLDPRVGRMILAARDNQALHEVLIIAAALSVQDPRDRPMEAQAAADAAHKKFADEKSEFQSYLKIWTWFEEAIAHKKTNRQLQDNCRANFLNQLRLREWREVHSQLLTIVKEQGWRINETPATYEQLHLALLTGLLGNIGYKADEEAHYLGARSIKFFIWPGSSLVKKAGRWIMAAELVDTTRLYGRGIAQINPEWLEKVGSHLLRKSYGEPRWEKRAGQVSAFERATLYGLVVYSQRRTQYGLTHPVEAREIFIREALVEGEFDTRAPFFAHNQKLVREIENLEHKSRRLDVLVDQELIVAFYDQLLPAEVYNAVLFEQWHQEAVKADAKLLYLNKDDLMRHEAAGITTDLFPKAMQVSGVALQLAYHFEPGSPRDGVTLCVPLFSLNQVSAERCEWLVPGMLKEKIHLLIKSLPQKIRRHCVPLPEYAAGFAERCDFGKGNFLDAVIADIRTQKGLLCMSTDFKFETLPVHLTMNFKVIDEHGRQLEMGRNLSTLRVEFGTQARESFQRIASADKLALLDRTGSAAAQPAVASKAAGAQKPLAAAAPLLQQQEKLTAWSFGSLPELLEVQQGKQTLIGYPALVDHLTHCQIEVFDDPDEAARIHRRGLRRLFALQLREQVKFLEKNIPGLQQMGMQFMALGSQEELREQIIETALERACLQAPLPATAEQFQRRREEGKARLNLLANEIARMAGQILAEYHSLPKKLQGIKAHTAAAADMQAQLQLLIGKRFIAETEFAQLTQFPRYLKAITVRMEKLRADPARDGKLLAEWLSVAQPWQRSPRKSGTEGDPKLLEFRWLLEELRVSLFAQELRTPMPVSVKRLQKVWDSLQR
ncbi:MULTISPECIES: ATP-dependent RNA helicase HrpA [unclassified Undibacterium]|uniref:ATP-dependent RNA helicase HrpA n=1 Tax=unclassified Undibacterium TaxID=2630295 RepID=UPI002AC9612F|nr:MULTISPECIES: ATP-dependent RNA helicase HrpA [unclassified Undibacterium]MEB0140143.1 ATP-dependent RNA helicase HrpA [Undibacterium sp. CCC2.1]MEB0173589.1 ATP-dependent RNA helicase HrpA [Undibacterium sp. CCC1.1]MEB0177555.1 ATP-dependent RNA helicase HrpA [Undibacterium sp. CCC3.4]MEB0214442.1 ATP-dependent RNA helicase HrpA [Undibacterium sp. 5I2]WPX42839.1 ATP-dependent RNA helicase HrpA [Undibacterium sp. CCC3.4]